MYTQVTIKFQDHIILLESGQHNLIIEHLKNIYFIAFDVKIKVICISLDAEGVEFDSPEKAINYIEKEYYNTKFKEVKND